ncbi:uncharacterized protein [Physcomitrium patens]|uniref:DUF1664 domain-containing protein n=1 Tax=Physcomitrium patens TaxID=3218 RepID=A0A7I4FHS0_PHYPA|nr:uncharacterized protein LOC112277199 isoform X1 [Physcomitrium patens]XP_024365036.1 uncharacterized protein LOC112277199 isoform X1 [Physcomitrium patens]XP_024365037.1 uncharacterized protein LOC112277199 isoform X1 [Physcomitrium patens]|eukprot:XP_024365035.1 uncharacterized protein LOC112277199 isoform X1 [Physcomitrella patens]
MATSRLLLVVGAGTAGSLALRNPKVAELLNDLSQVVTKHLSEEDGSGGENSALAAQVQRLTQELRYLASSPRNVTVVNGGSSTNYSSLILPAATIGIVGYGYIKWKGLKWTDFMYVTRKHMTNAVASVSKQLETVSTALQATKRQLTAKLEGVTKSLDDSMILQGLIRNQVTEVQSEVVRANGEIGEVQRLVLGLEGKIDEVQANQEIANQGIVLLCRFVASLDGFQSLSSRSLQRSVSTPQSLTSGGGDFLWYPGLKELQYFTELLATGSPGSKDQSNDMERKTNETEVTPINSRPVLGGKPLPSPAVRRSFSFRSSDTTP